LNRYGDIGRALPGDEGFGHDINYDRRDSLDLKAEQRVARLLNRRRSQRVTVLDLGCGLGRQSVEFARRGANVFSVDLIDASPFIREMFAKRQIDGNQENWFEKIHFLQKDLREIDFSSLGADLDIVYSQRTIHYLRYNEAVSVLRAIRDVTSRAARAYIGVSGLHSPLGYRYPDASKDIRDRFAMLDQSQPSIAIHGITQPVCLYTREDLGQLMNESGFYPISIQTSPFGNIKGIFKVQK
jgi:SAM-dependent methyltransferase